MEKLTNKHLDILFNLIIEEQRKIHNQNRNIKPLLEEYKNELDNIIKIICNSFEEEKD